MARLIGKKAGDIIVEYLGPIVGRNYFSDGTGAVLVAPTVQIQVFGDPAASVRLDENSDFIFLGSRASNYGSQSAINLEKHPDPAGWAPVGAAITGAAGLTTRAPTVLGNPDPVFLRVVVVAPSTNPSAYVTISSHWS